MKHIQYDDLVEQLAARCWSRMTRTTTPYAELNEHDQRACRALVEPVVRDLLDLAATRIQNVQDRYRARSLCDTDDVIDRERRVVSDLAHITIDLTEEPA